jgi:hypothetical protein|tara:strand:+ start:242 stop:739 length:498 start_codon:yes stop_codon:yes gene_type:complete
MTRASDTARLLGAGGTFADGDLAFASGHGISFASTSDAGGMASELLDDYEEGSYTPDVFHTSSDNSTWSTKTGSYVKVGKQVTTWGVCDNGNSGTAGSALKLSLPFTPSGVNIMCGGYVTYNGTSHGDTLGWQLTTGTTAILYVPSGFHTNQVTYIGFFITFTVA